MEMWLHRHRILKHWWLKCNNLINNQRSNMKKIQLLMLEMHKQKFMWHPNQLKHQWFNKKNLLWLQLLKLKKLKKNKRCPLKLPINNNRCKTIKSNWLNNNSKWWWPNNNLTQCHIQEFLNLHQMAHNTKCQWCHPNNKCSLATPNSNNINNNLCKCSNYNKCNRCNKCKIWQL